MPYLGRALSTFTTSRKEVLRDKYLLEQDVQKITNSDDRRVKKVAVELKIWRQKLRDVQDALADCGATILSSEQQIAAL